jgi:hypothetical protein
MPWQAIFEEVSVPAFLRKTLLELRDEGMTLTSSKSPQHKKIQHPTAG